MRGEDGSPVNCNTSASETPPRARGRPAISYCLSFFCGNTPACAGKTLADKPIAALNKKHPRVRGEDLGSGQSQPDELETPPRARGRQSLENLKKSFNRNTPACAGKTGTSAYSASMKRKHPRVRGEDEPSGKRTIATGETPPRARGRLSAASSSK